LIGSLGDVTIFIDRPISGTLLVIAFALFLAPVYVIVRKILPKKVRKLRYKKPLWKINE